MSSGELSLSSDIDPLHLFRPGEFPQALEFENIQSAIANEINKIARLSEQIELLTRERNDANISLTKWKALITPVRRVPPEILSEIMQCVVEPLKLDFWDENVLDYHRSSEANVVAQHLSQVCSNWRQTAFSTPTLWELSLLDNSPPRESQQHVRLLQNHGQSLFVAIDFSHDQPPAAALTNILDHSGRWQSLQLYFSSNRTAHLNDPFAPAHHSMSSLVELCVVGSPPSDSQLTETDVPSLRKVALGKRLIRVPWAQLTSLKMGAFEVGEVTSVLVQCSVLQEFKLHRLMTTTEHDVKKVNVIANSLIELNIHCLSTGLMYSPTPGSLEAGCALLNSLTLPALRDLELLSRELDFWDMPTVESLLSRSACRLRRLAISTYRHHQPNDIVACIRAAPTLQQLYLAGDPMRWASQAQMLSRLDVSIPQQEMIAPNLTDFEIGFDGSSSAINSLKGVIRSRWPKASHEPVVPLRSVVVYSNSLIATHEGIQPLKDEGFNIMTQFKYGGSVDGQSSGVYEDDEDDDEDEDDYDQDWDDEPDDEEESD